MSRATVITLSVLLFVGLVAAVTIGVLNYVNDNDKRPSTSTKAVQEICQPTDYKEACFKSLSKVHTDDPKELVKAAFESTIAEISEVANKSTVLKELQNDPKTAEAVKDCKELFQDAIDDLQRSFAEMGEFDFNKVDKILENLKIWLSATITYQETCLDGFDNTTGDAGEKVRKILELSMQMSSNGLAIVSEMSTLLGTLDISSFNRRRLLSDDRHGIGHDHGNNGKPFWQWNRRLLSSTYSKLQEDDEPDKRRSRLLSSVNQVIGHDKDEMPMWLDGYRLKLLEATNLAEDLKAKANVTVAQDGSGKYKTIEEGLMEIPKNGNESFIIYIKEGVYYEYLVLYKWMTNVVFVGDGPTKTRITNNQNFADGTRTFKTATLSVLGDFFMAKDIGIENSAGAIKHQAVALRVQSDKSIFYNCHMDGYQDTLYTHTYRQFYRDCRVTGTIDFIFGDAAAFFQNCTFVVRKPLENQRCIVTAQGRMERHQPTGIIIHKCRFEADPEYYPVRKKNTAYLGRPWKEYSKTIIMESYIDDLISPDGWLPWEGDFALETCYYGEFNNIGPGSDMTNRVRWRGIKTITHDRAEKLMPPQLYGNDDWIKASGIPYEPTLSGFAPGPESGFDEHPNAPEGAPLYLPASTYGSSTSSSSTTSSSSSASSASHSSSSSSSSSGGSSFPGTTKPSTGSSTSSSSSSSSNPGGNDKDASKSTPTENTGGSTDSSSTTTPSSNSQGSTGHGSTGSSSATTPSGNKQGSAGHGSTDMSSTTTPSGSDQRSTGHGSSSTSTADDVSTGHGSTGSSSSTPTFTAGGDTTTPTGETATTTGEETTSEGGTMQSTTFPPIDAPSPSPVSMEQPTIPTYTMVPTAAILETKRPTTAAISQSPAQTPSSSPTKEQKRTGPITVRELERILMANEEMGGEEDDEAKDVMLGNVPDGDEPSSAQVESTSPTPAPMLAPTPMWSISLSPSLSPSGPSPSPSPSEGPSEEVADWFPPATAPGPDIEPADKVPPENAPPPKKNKARSNSKLYNLDVILSSMVLCFVFAM